MRCPHCNKTIKFDPLSPQALYLYCFKKVQYYKRMLSKKKRSLYDLNPPEEAQTREYREQTKTLKKWDAWAKWINGHIEAEKKEVGNLI